MTPEDLNFLMMIITPLVTAVMTAMVTAKANKRVLDDIIKRLDSFEARLFSHEERLSRLEGKFNGVARK